jgi:hypothetical protein
MAIGAINSGVPKPDKFKDEQVDLEASCFLSSIGLHAARLHYVNAWM